MCLWVFVRWFQFQKLWNNVILISEWDSVSHDWRTANQNKGHNLHISIWWNLSIQGYINYWYRPIKNHLTKTVIVSQDPRQCNRNYRYGRSFSPWLSCTGAATSRLCQSRVYQVQIQPIPIHSERQSDGKCCIHTSIDIFGIWQSFAWLFLSLTQDYIIHLEMQQGCRLLVSA